MKMDGRRCTAPPTGDTTKSLPHSSPRKGHVAAGQLHDQEDHTRCDDRQAHQRPHRTEGTEGGRDTLAALEAEVIAVEKQTEADKARILEIADEIEEEKNIAYINFLHTEHFILVPSLNKPDKDQKALQ